MRFGVEYKYAHLSLCVETTQKLLIFRNIMFSARKTHCGGQCSRGMVRAWGGCGCGDRVVAGGGDVEGDAGKVVGERVSGRGKDVDRVFGRARRSGVR